MAQPKVVTICGSSKFIDVMAVCSWMLERDERAIVLGLHLLPVWYARGVPDHIAEREGVAKQMDELHLAKIDMSDEIFVVNRFGYIGKSTEAEIRHAASKEIDIRYYRSDPIGKKVEKIIEIFMKDMERAKKRIIAPN